MYNKIILAKGALNNRQNIGAIEKISRRLRGILGQ